MNAAGCARIRAVGAHNSAAVCARMRAVHLRISAAVCARTSAVVCACVSSVHLSVAFVFLVLSLGFLNLKPKP
jgi:hypothetical protein